MSKQKQSNKVVIHEKVFTKKQAHPRLTAEEVAKALGGEVVGRIPASDPITLLHIGMALQERLRSTGGRPGLEGTQQTKIPVRKGDIELLEKLAERIREQFEIPVTWTQTASMLVTLGLRNVAHSTDSLQGLSGQQIRELVKTLDEKDK